MSEDLLYSPICFRGLESKIFTWQGLWLSCAGTLHPDRVLNAVLYLESMDFKGYRQRQNYVNSV